MIYLYAITGPLTQPIQGRGLEGAALQAEEMGALTAIYSTHDKLPLRADADACWAHEEAVEAVMAVQTVLPARFGTTFIDLDALHAAVRDDATSLEERLEQIDGCVELAVRIDPLGSEDGQTASGQQYLRDKLSAQRRHEALAESTLACLRELAVASTLAASQTQGSEVSISYLVTADSVDVFSRAVGRLQRRWPHFGLSCTGPWAPYSFADGAKVVLRERVA
jgi:hypothetical protein